MNGPTEAGRHGVRRTEPVRNAGSAMPPRAPSVSSSAASGSRPSPSLKTILPALPPSLVPRPRLDTILDGLGSRRLTAVVADAGFGKSTLLADRAAGDAWAWYTITPADRALSSMAAGIVESIALRIPGLAPSVATLLGATLGPEAEGDARTRGQACAGLLADALQAVGGRELVLVLDDVHEIGPDDPGAWFIEALCRQAPPSLHLVLSSRDVPPFRIERLRGQGHAATVGGTVLAFDDDETGALLGALLDDADPELTAAVQRATGGWPAAVRLAAEALRDVSPAERPRRLERLLRPSGPLFAFLAEEVLDREPSGVRRLILTVAPLPRFTAELCRDLGLDAPEATIASLEARGLFVQSLGDGDWYALHPLIRDFAVAQGSGPDPSDVADRAATWFEGIGAYRDAIDCLRLTSNHERTAALLDRHGGKLLLAGDVETIVTIAETLPEAVRTPVIHALEGEARQVRGDWEGALSCFRLLASGDGPIAPGIAWRMGLIHHLRGELDAALTVYARGRLDDTQPADQAMLEAWWASALWLRGDVTGCRTLAAAALADAGTAESDSALAAAHTVMAMLAALDSDRRANDAHYLRALDHAGRANDVLQAIRIHANRGSRLFEEAYFDDAIAELDVAIRLADVAGFAAFHALALSNRGEALRALGRLDEAIADLEAARQVYQRLESRLVSYPLGHLGDVHFDRGAYALARSCYEEAITVAEASGDLQGLVPSLAGLARVVAAEDLPRALKLAERAVSTGPVLGRVTALLALGAVALGGGDPATARGAARDAAEIARARRDRAGLARALELSVLAAPDPQGEVKSLREALAIWQAIGAPIGAARVTILLNELAPGPDTAAAAVAAEATLRSLGVAQAVARARSDVVAHALIDPEQARREAIGRAPVVRTLGGFEVIRDDGPVPTAEWGSKKARDLLKILISRRGTKVPRDHLMEILWPGDDPALSSRRLSVALSTLRAVLTGVDRDDRGEAGRYVAADRSAVWLVDGAIEVDIDTFLADAAAGLKALTRSPSDREAYQHLRAAEAAYRGDFLAEAAYDDWAVPLREEARSVYVAVCHALAETARTDGDSDAGATYLRRILEAEPFDERAHLSLVAALGSTGRHGEARRAYRGYLARMEEIGVEAASFPA